MQISDSLLNELISNPVFKPDTRAIFFLLQNPEPVSSDDIAGATGISRKGANRAVKRLAGAGLIIPGEFQAKKRPLIITGGGHIESSPVTEKIVKESGILAERLDRIETMIGLLLDRPAPVSVLVESTGTILSTTEPINGLGVINTGMTGTAQDIMSPVNGLGVINTGMTGTAQDIMSPVNGLGVINTGMTGPAQDINGIASDPIVTELDDAITRAGARLAALKAASFNKEKAANSSFSSTPASIGEVFKGLFGVQVPSGFTDTAAVEVMVARKKAGKLDNVKSPLAYLSSLSGKVQPPNTSKSTELQPSVSPPPASSNLPSVTDNRLSHADMVRIDSIWDAIDHSQYKEKALAKDQTGKKYPVPVELLARSIFNAEMMAAQGGGAI